jgi:hypothetical protein
MKSARHGLIAILFSILVLPVSAPAVPLGELSDIDGVPFPGASISQGDKLFTNFSAFMQAVGSTFDSFLGIEVSGITVGQKHGLRFDGPFEATSIEIEVGQLDLRVAFDVTATVPNLRVHEVTVTLAGGTLLGEAFAGLTAGPASVAVSNFDNEPGTELEFGPRTGIGTLSPGENSVLIDTQFVLATGVPGAAQTRGFDVLFAQSVAEPSIVLLLVFGAGLIAAIAHKVRQA